MTTNNVVKQESAEALVSILADREQLNKLDSFLAAVINPIPLQKHGIDVPLDYLHQQLDSWKADYGLYLTPNFQRGHVWTQAQQIAYIESWLRGSVGEQGRTITLNCPEFGGRLKAPHSDLNGDMEGLVCVDGLQRLSAVLGFIDGKFKVFTNSEIPGFEKGLKISDLNNSSFSMRTKNLRFQIYTMDTQAEILNYYLAFNDGGTVHDQEEINRVKQMHANLVAKK